MEHRLSPRVQASIPVVVSLRGGNRVRCRIRNASHDGLFIAMDAGTLGIARRSTLAVKLVDDNGECDPGAGDTVYVVHRDMDGVGVMLTSLGGALRESVRRLIETRAARRQTAPAVVAPAA